MNFMLPVPDASLPAVEDLLGQVRGGVHELRVLHAEVGQEHDLDPTGDDRIGVHASRRRR